MTRGVFGAYTLRAVSQLLSFDDQVLRWVNQFVHVWPLLDEFVAWILNAEAFKFGPLVLAICWFWFHADPRQALRRRLLIETVLSTGAALFVGRLLALTLPFRLRPVFRPELAFDAPFEVGLRTWSAFPSDNAVMAFALSASLYRVSPRVGAWALFHSTFFICFPRLYAGLHHPTDLIGGALIGIALVAATARLVRRYPLTDSLLEAERRHPGAFYALGFVVLYELTSAFSNLRWLALSIFAAIR